MAEQNKPVTRIPSIFDSEDDSDDDDAPSPLTYKSVTAKPQSAGHVEEASVSDNLSSNSEESGEPSLSLKHTGTGSPEEDKEPVSDHQGVESTSDDTIGFEGTDVKDVDDLEQEMAEVGHKNIDHADTDDDDDDDDNDENQSISQLSSQIVEGPGDGEDLSDVSDDLGGSSSSLPAEDDDGIGAVDNVHSHSVSSITGKYKSETEKTATADKGDKEGEVERVVDGNNSECIEGESMKPKSELLLEESSNGKVGDGKRMDMEIEKLGTRKEPCETSLKSEPKEKSVTEKQIKKTAEDRKNEMEKTVEDSPVDDDGKKSLDTGEGVMGSKLALMEGSESKDHKTREKSAKVSAVGMEGDEASSSQAKGVLVTLITESSSQNMNRNEPMDIDDDRNKLGKGNIVDNTSCQDDNSTDRELKIALPEDDVEMERQTDTEVNSLNTGAGNKPGSENITSPKRTQDSPETPSDTESIGPERRAPHQSERTSGGRIKVEDVYTDSEQESHGGTSECSSKVKNEVCGSETDSADPEDMRDSSSQQDSSRASSIEPCQTSLASGDGTGTLTPQAKRGKWSRKHSTFNLEDCMKAFQQGWKRELVHRATVDPTKSGGIRSDIYYYSPSGKKLRSKVEIEDYLYKNKIMDLTLKNFTMVKDPLGVSEEYETIRHASKVLKVGASSKVWTPSPTTSKEKRAEFKKKRSLDEDAKEKTPAKRARMNEDAKEKTPAKRARMKITPIVPLHMKMKNSSSAETTQMKGPATCVKGPTTPAKGPSAWPKLPATVPKGPATQPIGPVTQSKVVTTQPKAPSMQPKGQIQVKRSSSQLIVAPRPMVTVADLMGVSGTMRWVQPISKPGPASKKQIVYTTKISQNPPPRSERILTPLLTSETSQKTFHCTGHCPLGGGTVPCLQCVKCLCLFHPECTYTPPLAVNIIQAGSAKFLCPNCYRENKENSTSSSWVPAKAYEPLAHDPASDESGEELDIEVLQAGPVEQYTKVSLQPPYPPSPPISPKSHASSLRTIRPKKSSWASDVAPAVTTVPAKDGSESSPVVVSSSSSGNVVMSQSGHAGSPMFQLQHTGGGQPRFLLVRGGTGGEMVSLPTGNQVRMPTSIILPTSLVSNQMPVVIPSSTTQLQPAATPIIIPTPMQQQVPTTVILTGNVQRQPATAPLFLSGSTTSNIHSGSSSNSLEKQQMDPFNQYSNSAVTNAQDMPVILEHSSPKKSTDVRQFRSSLTNAVKETVPSYTKEEKNFIQGFCQNYRILVRIFQYLTVKDLLTASEVCLLWRDLAYSQSMWKTIHLRNVGVRDWNSFASFLERRDTRSLDLRKMRIYYNTSRNRTEMPEMSMKMCHASDIVSHVSENNVTVPPSKMSASSVPGDDLPESDSYTKRTDVVGKEAERSGKSTVAAKETGHSELAIQIKTDEPLDITDKNRKSGDVHECERLESTSSCDLEELKRQQKRVVSTEGKSEVDSEKKKCIFVDKLKEEDKAETEEMGLLREKPEESDMPSQSTCSDGASMDMGVGAASAVPLMDCEMWKTAFECLGQVRCLKRVVLPRCAASLLQLLLRSCHQLTSVIVPDLHPISGNTSFDPAYLLETPDLETFHITAAQGFSFTTQFDFIRLLSLRNLVMRGLNEPWPYLSTVLTSLHLKPIGNSPSLWANIGCITNLEVLIVEDGGSVNDFALREALIRLQNLQRLCFVNFTLGPKLGATVNKLKLLRHLAVLPRPAEQTEESVSEQTTNMVVLVQSVIGLKELVWGIRSQDMHMDCIFICQKLFKANFSWTGGSDSGWLGDGYWPLPVLEKMLKRVVRSTKLMINKVDDPASWIHSSGNL